MSGSGTTRFQALLAIAVSLAALLPLAACTRPDGDRVQGYVEGEFVYVAAALPGALESLLVRRGAQVKAGDPLFVLDSAAEKAEIGRASCRERV